MAITEKTRKTIWARSGNRCAICRTELVLEKDPFENSHLNLGEECHIISRQPNGPRHQQIPSFDYDSPDNLLLLCCNDHKTVDEQIQKFPVDKLKEIKSDHELRVKSNLDSTGFPQKEKVEPSKFDSIVSFVTAKHDIEMNIKTNQAIFDTTEGLQLAFKEADGIKDLVKELVKQITLRATQYQIQTRDNKQRICDIRFNGFTLLIQFYQAYGNSARNSYLLFAIVRGYFDENGYADPFHPAKVLHIIRLDFDCTDNDFGWRNQEGKKEFYLSKEITELWIEKYFKVALDDKNKAIR
jgi:hypothetical protein